MASITLKGNSINTLGDLPSTGSEAPNFELVKTDLSTSNLSDYKGKRVVLNIFPSLDTGVCAASVRKFNQELEKLENVEVLCISKDLPFAHGRFCETEGIKNVVNLSDFRNLEFGKAYGTTIVDGPLAGVHSRAIVIVNEEGKVVYTEQVPEITQDPDFEKALAVLN
ncbi:MAG: thiol peroxidase [Bacteroidales bacterium]|nr:thiol peroxidase [Bacteroidales bacterium]